MIECELCGESFNEEEMRECPECLKVMCEECYERGIILNYMFRGDSV